jgi:hypothetical protein
VWVLNAHVQLLNDWLLDNWSPDHHPLVQRWLVHEVIWTLDGKYISKANRCPEKKRTRDI